MYGAIEDDLERTHGSGLFNAKSRNSRSYSVVAALGVVAVVIIGTKGVTGESSTVLKYVSGQCIGGCEINGPPLALGSDIQAKKVHSSQAYLSAYQSLDELPFDQVVQLGEHSIGKPFQDYTADQEGQAVMGKAYTDTPFSATLASTVPDNAARNWDFLDVNSEGGTLPKGY